jgi:hypothetical protein
MSSSAEAGVRQGHARRTLGRVLRAGVVGALATIALVGCIRIDEEITFNAQGGGTYEIHYGMDADALKEMSSMGGSSGGSSSSGSGTMSEAEKNDLIQKLGPGSTVVPDSVEEDGTTYDGVRIFVPFANAERFNAIGPALDSGSGGSGAAFAGLRVTVQGDTYTATGKLTSLTEGGGSGGTGADADMARMMASLLGDAIHYVSITVPGQVTATDADDKDGNTYYWEASGSDPTREIKISWRPSGNPANSVRP